MIKEKILASLKPEQILEQILEDDIWAIKYQFGNQQGFAILKGDKPIDKGTGLSINLRDEINFNKRAGNI